MVDGYSLDELTRSYRWMGHDGSYTELNGLHPEYRPGKTHFDWNVQRRAFPRIWYVRSEMEVVRFAQRFGGSRMVCYGINPRSSIFKNKSGYARAALDTEIAVSQNILFDLDFEDSSTRSEQTTDLEGFLEKTDEYFLDQGLKPPVRGFSGRGYHLLFAYPAIKVRDSPDIRERLAGFRDNFHACFRRELEGLEVKLDRTQDLRRMVRIYGTAKPDIGIPSHFYGHDRVEDHALQNHLLDLQLPEQPSGRQVVVPRVELPSWFEALLEHDVVLRQLWRGTGKSPNTDTTRTGYDYSLTKGLLCRGYKDIDELATILALRPEGAVRKSGKGDQYISRTIANALVK